jgi:hypothetical protein
LEIIISLYDSILINSCILFFGEDLTERNTNVARNVYHLPSAFSKNCVCAEETTATVDSSESAE